jgi:hypothetical protein
MHPDTVDKQLSEKAAYMKRKRAEESGEKRKERRRKNAIRAKQNRESKTPEQHKERLSVLSFTFI